MKVLVQLHFGDVAGRVDNAADTVLTGEGHSDAQSPEFIFRRKRAVHHIQHQPLRTLFQHSGWLPIFANDDSMDRASAAVV